MKKIATVTGAALSALLLSTAALSDVQSLRGEKLDAMAKQSEKHEVMNVKGGIERSYKQQPPMIPHEVAKYEINLKVNGCLSCHSEKTYQEKKAPKVGDSHYMTRDGKVLPTLSSRRYFCTQCHAPQENADPLVQNNFHGAK
jgi:nitrate reductase (cytochrome), electron transfer subunit